MHGQLQTELHALLTHVRIDIHVAYLRKTDNENKDDDVSDDEFDHKALSQLQNDQPA